MAKTRISKSKQSSRPALSTGRIAAAALDLVDREGLDGFSFRVLARALKCEAMSLYHYFPSKAHLFDAMLDIYLAEIPIPPVSLPWLDRLTMLAREFRLAALRHPGFFPFMSVHRLNTLSGLKFLSEVLAALESSGLPDEARARHFRALGYYLTGAALDETMGYAKGPSAAEPVSGEVVQREFPGVVAVGRFFAKSEHEATFEHGLQILLRSVAADAQSALQK